MGSLLRGYLVCVYTTLNCNLIRVLWKSLQPFYFWGNLDVSTTILLNVTRHNGIRCIMLCGAHCLPLKPIKHSVEHYPTIQERPAFESRSTHCSGWPFCVP